MPTFENLGKKKVVLGMVHLGALPGTPFFVEGSYEAVKERAVADARALEAGGADGCVVQNAGDRVFAVDDADKVIVVGMTDIVRAIRETTGPAFQIGVQILRNDLKGAWRSRTSAGIVPALRGAGGIDDHRVGDDGGESVRVPGVSLAHRGAGREADRRDLLDALRVAGGASRWATWPAPRAHAGADAVSLCDPDDDRTERFIQEVRAAVPGMPIVIGGYTNHGNAARLLEGRGRGHRRQRVRGGEPVRDGAGGGGAGVRGYRVAAVMTLATGRSLRRTDAWRRVVRGPEGEEPCPIANGWLRRRRDSSLRAE